MCITGMFEIHMYIKHNMFSLIMTFYQWNNVSHIQEANVHHLGKVIRIDEYSHGYINVAIFDNLVPCVQESCDLCAKLLICVQKLVLCVQNFAICMCAKMCDLCTKKLMSVQYVAMCVHNSWFKCNNLSSANGNNFYKIARHKSFYP